MNVHPSHTQPRHRDAVPSTRPPRDERIDFVKGLLIVLTVYGHVDHVGSLAALQVAWTRDIYSFHMQVFVILSGYLFLPRLETRPILEPVLRRLVVPYVVFETLFLVCLMAAAAAGIHTTTRPPRDAAELLVGVLVFPTGPPWFLHALIVVQLTLAGARWIAAKTPFQYVVFAVVAVLLLGALTEFGYLKRWVAVCFFAGLALVALRAGDRRRLATGLAMTAGAMLFVRRTPLVFSALRLLWDLFVLGVLAVGAGSTPRRVLRPVAALGRRSLEVVVLHSFVLVAAKPLAPHFVAVDRTGLSWSALVACAGIAGSLAAAAALERLGLGAHLFGTARGARPGGDPVR